MGNRYAEDIKRIVGIDPNQNVLGLPAKKASIAGKRGIGYINGRTGGAEGVSGASGVTQLSTDLGTSNNGDVTQANNSGEQGLDPNEPYNGMGTDTTGVKDAKDIIDGTDDASKLSVPQVTDAGLEYDNDNALSGINAKDCDTGADITIRTRHDFVPPVAQYDTEGNLLSERWDDAETPPYKAGFAAGYYWEIQGAGVPTNYAQASTTYSAIIAFNGLLNAQQGDAPYEFLRFTDDGGGSYTVYYKDTDDDEVNFPMSKVSCSVTPPDESGSCPVSAPLEEHWPQDNKYDLRLQAGQFVSSEYDSDVPLKYKNPSSRIDFCFDTGGSRQGTMEVTKDGGFMIYETSAGVPSGIIRAYDRDGRLSSAFDSASGWINLYRP